LSIDSDNEMLINLPVDDLVKKWQGA
jgi:hypothetical protein